jgi:hypothetical protein
LKIPGGYQSEVCDEKLKTLHWPRSTWDAHGHLHSKCVEPRHSYNLELFSAETVLERRARIEPANAGFADLRVSHFATGAYVIIAEIRPK